MRNYERRIGKRRILGTDYPIEAVVYKIGRKWIPATICNGIAESRLEFATQREAIAHADGKKETIQ